jgi:Rad3-related DNA helicase
LEHSIEEYERDRFCRDCGTLLRRNFENEIRVKGWGSLFPYEPYLPQVKFMNDVQRVVGSGGVLIAEACNGFGKTASALSALLAMKRPIVYATRTHEQVRQVLSEISTINKKKKEKYTAVNLASRRHLCLNPDCQELPLREAHELCRTLREDHSCLWTPDINTTPRGLPPVVTQRILMEVGRRFDVCPYYLARKLSQHCTVVVVPYPYVFDIRVRSGAGLDIEGKILVLDEGHNLDKVGQDTLSDTLSEFALDIAAEELKAVKMTTRFVRRLQRHIQEHVSDRPNLRSADSLERDLELALGTDLLSFIDKYTEAVEKIRSHKIGLGDPPTSYFNGVLTFLSLINQSNKEKYIALYQIDARGRNILQYRCLDPSLAIQPVAEASGGVLVMSGTLSPLDLFAEVIGLEEAVKKSYPSIQDPRKIQTVIDTRITTAYRERSKNMILTIGRIIASEVADVPHGALLFFTQKKFMHKCLDIWGTNGIIETSRGLLHFADKPLYIEGRTASRNRDIVTRYKRSAVGPEGAVLCCVFRGRNSEGSNFPDSQARGIFLVGVPYANYGDPLVKAQIGYYNRQALGLGNRWYTMDAFRAANQALGRGIRGIEDWCHYWLLDRRYAQHANLVSKWALGSNPKFIEI